MTSKFWQSIFFIAYAALSIYFFGIWSFLLGFALIGYMLIVCAKGAEKIRPENNNGSTKSPK
jgi:hypothetical protein